MAIFHAIGIYMGDPPFDAEQVGRRLVRIQKVLGFDSQAEFGDFLGNVSRGRMNNWIKGVALIPVPYAVKLKELKGIPLDFIYCGDVSSLPKRFESLAHGETSSGE